VAKRARSKPGRQRRRHTLVAALAALALALAAAALYATQGRSPGSHGCTNCALIADGLSEDYPNPALIKELRALLEKAGYHVYVAEGRQVNLELYQHLTRYKLVILRVHGGVAVEHTNRGNTYLGGIFTGVPWSNNYTKLGIERYVAKARPILAPHRLYVAVLPRFWLEKLQGRFPPGSVMIVSSCWATADPKVIEALFLHNLSMYIGWNHKVTLQHADRALLELVKAVTEKHMNWEQAVYYVNQHLGPDPKTGAQLYYALRKHYHP